MSHKPNTIVVYGGTFDPFHLGHESVCRAILRESCVDELRVVPCYLPALKSRAAESSEHRLAMLRAWADSENDARIVVDDLEIRRQGKTHTVDTLKALGSLFPQSNLVFALGMDAWNGLSKWYQVEELIELVNFWVFSRQGESVGGGMAQIQAVANLAELFGSTPGRCFFDDQAHPELASSVIRAGQDTERWPVPAIVKQYINNQALYQNNGAHMKV